jgi:staphylococcal nuclease domain-containing protein 1
VTAKAAEPFGEEAKRHARLSLLQRTVEITCIGVSLTGVVTGHLYVGTGQQRADFGLELICAGLATVDQRKIEQGYAPKSLLEAQNQAVANRVGLWSVENNRADEVRSIVFKYKP